MKIYKKPGRGRKQCPECKVYLGARNTDCLCGYVFSEKINKDKPIQSKPKSGFKRCPECEKHVGLRTKICPECKYTFIAGQSTKLPKSKPKTPDEEEASQFLSVLGLGSKVTRDVILTPSEKCPIKLYDTTEEDVWEFCEFLLAEGKIRGKIYAPTALRYFVRETYNINSTKYKSVIKHIQKWIYSKGVSSGN